MVVHQNGGSSTCVVEAPSVELGDLSHYITKPEDAKLPTDQAKSREVSTSKDGDDPIERLPSPTTQAEPKLEQWNFPRRNLYRTAAAFWSFIVMGANDAAYGVSSLPSRSLYSEADLIGFDSICTNCESEST